MDYSVTRLTTAAECDAALLDASDLKQDLQFETTVLNRELDDRQRTAIEIDTDLASVVAQMTAYQAARDQMAPSPERDTLDSRIRRLNDRRENLLERKNKTGNVALLFSQLEHNRIERQITEIDAFVAAVTAHKATLP